MNASEPMLPRKFRGEYKTPERKRLSCAKTKAKRQADPEKQAKDRAYQLQYRRENKKRIAELQAKRQRRMGPYIRLKRKKLSVEFIARVHAVTACEICGGPPDGRWKQFHVDHCHETGGFRGMLCSACNTGLSRFKDDPELLRSAARYIEGYRKMLPNKCL